MGFGGIQDETGSALTYISRDDIADKITELVLDHIQDTDIEENYQKTVRDGTIQRGRDPNDPDSFAILYESDVLANLDDLPVVEVLHTWISSQEEVSLSTLSMSPNADGVYEFSFSGYENNTWDATSTLDNLNQLLKLKATQAPIDPTKAGQLLDTHIYELLPPLTTKQQRINNFFSEYNSLKPPSARDTYTHEGVQYDPPLADTDENGLTDTYRSDLAEQYKDYFDISGADPTDEQDKRITWKQVDQDSDNTNKSLEWLLDDLQTHYFLEEDIEPVDTEQRPPYNPKSDGYLQIRSLNQAVIIRNQETDDVGFIGPDPDNPKWLTTGFTITMWVKFLDKVSSGTLFNFGNPTRPVEPTGFMLDTFVINKDELVGGAGYTWEEALTPNPGIVPEGGGQFFENDDYERFVRLVVRDGTQGVISPLRDSHVGRDWGTLEGPLSGSGFSRQSNIIEQDSDIGLLTYTRVPINLDEWYFIVANFNTGIGEDNSFDTEYTDCTNSCNTDSDFWRWNIDSSGYTHFSGEGAKCKVEIISKSDLLRARGFNPNPEE